VNWVDGAWLLLDFPLWLFWLDEVSP